MLSSVDVLILKLVLTEEKPSFFAKLFGKKVKLFELRFRMVADGSLFSQQKPPLHLLPLTHKALRENVFCDGAEQFEGTNSFTLDMKKKFIEFTSSLY